MTSSSRILVRRILIALLVVLLPAGASAQESLQTATSGSQGPAELQAVKANDSAAPVPQSAPEADAPVQQAAPASDAPGQSGKEPPDETAGTYIIKQGDTLWDISAAFLKDPFLWPFIWKANPYIANADLIYPGNKLIIPSIAPIERAIAAPEKIAKKAVQEPAPVDDRLEPTGDGGLFGRKSPTLANAPASAEPEKISRLLLPEAAKVPIADKFTVLRAGFVGFDQSDDRIVGIVGGEKTVYSYNDTVYVNIGSKTVAPGDKFLIFTPVHRVKHPVSGLRYGKLIRIDGVLEIVAPGTGGNFTARIILSFDTASKESMLIPYQDPPLIYENPAAKSKDIEGYVIDIREHQTMSSQNDCVYLDKGTADGVELGDRFLIYTKIPKKSYPKNLIGEAQVILVKERTATAIVNKSVDTLLIGNAVEYKK